MKDVLAQFQIDELLDDILDGKVEIDNDEVKKQRKVKKYDFKIPRKLAKEQLRTLFGVYELYARHLSSYLTGTLRTYCQVEVLSIEETKYYEYSKSMSEQSLLGVMDLNPFEGSVIMEFSRDLIFTIIDKLLGGSGVCGVMNRDYTDIEMVLMEKLYRNVIVYLKDAWINVADIEPIFRKFETGNTASNIMHIDEVVAIIVLNVKIKEITGKITVCLPFVWLESIDEKLYTKYRMTKRARNETDTDNTKQAIISKLYKSNIDVTANLGSVSLRLKDILSLEVGDVIKLNQNANDCVKVSIGNKTRFYGQFGILNNKKAVEILKIAE